LASPFLFGFGNVLNLALRLGVPAWVAPLVAPAVDLSILGLLLGIRQLALAGATPEQLRPARRLLIFASTVTLALNVADPAVAGEYGKAAFDAVGPLLLIGWADVGPDLLRALTIPVRADEATPDDAKRMEARFADEPTDVGQTAPGSSWEDTKPDGAPVDEQRSLAASNMVDDDLLKAGEGGRRASLERASPTDLRGHAAQEAPHRCCPLQASRRDHPGGPATTIITKRGSHGWISDTLTSAFTAGCGADQRRNQQCDLVRQAEHRG
jgi:hypothetical protein